MNNLPRCVFGLVFLLSFVMTASWIIKRNSHFGWDFDVYRASAEILSEGGNPYDLNQLQTKINFEYVLTYAPIFIYSFYPFRGQSPWFSVVLQTMLFLLLWRLSWRFERQKLFSLAYIFSGSWAFSWSIITGNLAIVEGLFFALALIALFNNQKILSAGWLGFGSSMKLLPLIYGLAWLQVPNRLKPILWGIFLFVLPNLLSAAILPDLTRDWWNYLLGGSNAKTPLQELSLSSSDPGVMNALYSLPQIFGGHPGGAVTFGLYGVLMALGAFAIFRFNRSSSSILDRVAFAFLIVGLLAPRLKPYSFSQLLFPALILLPRLKDSQKIILLFVQVFLSPVSIWLEGPLNSWPFMQWLCRLSQWSSLLITTLMIGYAYAPRGRPKDPEHRDPLLTHPS